MAAPAQGHPTGQATHYEVLNISPDLIASQQDASALIKRAYHRALLKNHPDKATAIAAAAGTGTSARTGNQPVIFSVDQITKAWTVLSSPRQRAEYDNELRLSGVRQRESGDGERFHTGVDDVDLDDIDLDEEKNVWHRSCRCGNDRGYEFTEDDLVEAADEGILLVGCQDCSLWLRVHFAMLD